MGPSFSPERYPPPNASTPFVAAAASFLRGVNLIQYVIDTVGTSGVSGKVGCCNKCNAPKQHCQHQYTSNVLAESVNRLILWSTRPLVLSDCAEKDVSEWAQPTADSHRPLGQGHRFCGQRRPPTPNQTLWNLLYGWIPEISNFVSIKMEQHRHTQTREDGSFSKSPDKHVRGYKST